MEMLLFLHTPLPDLSFAVYLMWKAAVKTGKDYLRLYHVLYFLPGYRIFQYAGLLTQGVH
jgi:hypothetical protein